jgi:hypothetical protein
MVIEKADFIPPLFVKNYPRFQYQLTVFIIVLRDLPYKIDHSFVRFRMHRRRKRRFLVGHILKFRAATVAVAHSRKLFRNHPQALRLVSRRPREMARALFSPDDRAYTSLRRALMKLPDDEVPGHLLPDLQLVRRSGRVGLPNPREMLWSCDGGFGSTGRLQAYVPAFRRCVPARDC